MRRGIAVAWSGRVKGRSYSFHLYDQNVTAITDVWAVSLQHRLQPGGEQMTPKPHKIAFIFATVLVVGAYGDYDMGVRPETCERFGCADSEGNGLPA
jgi:hypothetical protein